MSEVKDPKIKLFGRTIELPDPAPPDTAHSSHPTGEDATNQEPPCSSDSMLEDDNFNRDVEELDSRESSKQDHDKDKDQINHLTSEELKDFSDSRPIIEDPNAPSSETEAGTEKTMKNEDDRNETSNSQEKTLKKPDKIIPCPRCNSMDTKFCYFNNYNVNQPRHFCKNCQRYWTAGGTMRNVPVGAGRRKNKNSVSQFRHLTVPEALQGARVDLPNGIHHPALNPNGTVLTFGTDPPLCESMASVLNIVDKTVCSSSRNGFHKPEEVEMSVSDRTKESGDDSSSRSSTTASSSKDEVGKNGLPEMMSNCHPFPQGVPCYATGGPWPYPWNPVQWNSSASPPTFGPASFPVPFYSTAPPYWACPVPGAWNVPWVVSQTPNGSQGHTPPTSGPNSPTLGKHSRDDNMQKLANGEEGKQRGSNLEKNLWVPKTLRIDDPGEAAKSSIWATLGIKNDRADTVGGGGLFKAFQTQSKGDDRSHVSENSTVLQANPAALSRSLNFHERS